MKNIYYAHRWQRCRKEVCERCRKTDSKECPQMEAQINCNKIHNIKIISVLFNKCNGSINTFKVVCRQCLIFNFYAETIIARTHTHTSSQRNTSEICALYIHVHCT